MYTSIPASVDLNCAMYGTSANFKDSLKFLNILNQEEITRRPGDRWMIRGPSEYIPPVEVEVTDRRKAIPLDNNEGDDY